MMHISIPWNIPAGMAYTIADAQGRLITNILPGGGFNPEEAASIARFIVQACNAHEDLLAAVKDWMANGHMKGCYHADYPDNTSEFCHAGCKRLRAAIAKASPQAPGPGQRE